jgi:hypothetical protein
MRGASDGTRQEVKGMAVTGYPDAQYVLTTDYLTDHGVPVHQEQGFAGHSSGWKTLANGSKIPNCR